MFNPARPYLLYASFRRLDAIYAWDLRGDVSRPVEILDASSMSTDTDVGAGAGVGDAAPIPGLPRPSATQKASTKTNQRLRFDVDFGGRWLAAGDEVSSLRPHSLHCAVRVGHC